MADKVKDAHKMRHQNTFIEVLTNLDDQVIVRELLKKLVPLDVQERIVIAFNARVDKYNDYEVPSR